MDLLDKTLLLERPSPPLPQGTTLHAEAEADAATWSFRGIIHRRLMIPESSMVLYRLVQCATHGAAVLLLAAGSTLAA